MNRLVAAATLALSGFVMSGVAQTTVRFTDVTREAGVSFQHVNGASPDKHLVETMRSGGLFFDIVTIQEGRGLVGRVPFVR